MKKEGIMDEKTAQSINQAGTGMMITLSETIRKLQLKGYKENIIPKFDHLECRSGEIKLDIKDFVVDEIVRFENTSDPDDQAILYAITAPKYNLKGIYSESYGLYHDNLSEEMKHHLTERKLYS
jgi:hypothetical protein